MKSNEMAVPATQVDALLSRRVEGEELFELFGELEPLTAHDEVKLPLDAKGTLDPRVTLARNRELQANRRTLWPLNPDSEEFLPRLTEGLPGLTEPITGMVTKEMCWNRPRGTKNHFLSLYFERKIANRLAEEQLNIWDELANMAGHDRDILAWDPYEPRMLVIALGAAIKTSPVARIRSHILRRAPFAVTLLPVGEPRQPQAD